MNSATASLKIARGLHAEQTRRYTGDPYIAHLCEVAGYVAPFAYRHQSEGVSAGVVFSVSYLHDSKEDQGVTDDMLREEFGLLIPRKDWNAAEIELIIEGVTYMTDPPHSYGNRAARKAATMTRLAGAPAWVQDIKCADILSNTTSIAQHDPKFGQVYVGEVLGLLDVLSKADPLLMELACKSVHQARDHIRWRLDNPHALWNPNLKQE